MAVRSIGTLPIQVAWQNDNRFSLVAEFLPASIVAGNTGLIYGKFGSAPVATPGSNSWDFVLNSGSTDGTNINESLTAAPDKRDLWLVSDTADQKVNIIERHLPQK